MSYLYINESFNLYVGKDDADNDKRLLIQNASFPDMEEITQGHHAGGSTIEIEVGGLGVKALSSKFKTTGWDPQTLSKFGLQGKAQLPFTITSVVRNKNGNAAVSVRAVMWGRLTKITPDQLKRGDLMAHDHEIKEIIHYELYFGGVEKYYWDFFGRVWRVDGVNQNQDELNYL